MSATTAQCPVCSTPISQTRYAEIQDRIRKEEQGKLALQAEKLRAQHAVSLKAASRDIPNRTTGQARSFSDAIPRVLNLASELFDHPFRVGCRQS